MEGRDANELCAAFVPSFKVAYLRQRAHQGVLGARAR